MSNETILLTIRFKIGGSLRFLSHAETVKVFQRACARAGLKIQHSQGFNPRPKLSLPLPRSVGIESDDDLLCLRVNRDLNETAMADYESRIKARLSGQLPVGCELLSVSVAGANTSFRPSGATYVLMVQPEYLNENLKAAIKRVLASESLNLQRRIDIKDSRPRTQDPGLKTVDVRAFLKSIDLDGRSIIIECKISSAGTIRVEEILRLLELDVEKLAAPIRRTNVQWQSN
ncbi:MAG: TIGR03936 family radical SAM-associated protein [Planctomycetota bacterium]